MQSHVYQKLHVAAFFYLSIVFSLQKFAYFANYIYFCKKLHLINKLLIKTKGL